METNRAESTLNFLGPLRLPHRTAEPWLGKALEGRPGVLAAQTQILPPPDLLLLSFLQATDVFREGRMAQGMRGVLAWGSGPTGVGVTKLRSHRCGQTSRFPILGHKCSMGKTRDQNCRPTQRIGTLPVPLRMLFPCKDSPFPRLLVPNTCCPNVWVLSTPCSLCHPCAQFEAWGCSNLSEAPTKLPWVERFIRVICNRIRLDLKCSQLGNGNNNNDDV